MKLPRFTATIACLALPMVSGCATTGTQPTMAEGSKLESPILSASTVGGCTKPSHQPFPEYGTQVPYHGAPTPTRKVPPVYPEAARAAGVQGTVVLAALVCEHGRVVKTRVIDSIPLLDAAATDCVRQWDFSAANIRDLRVAAWTTIPVTFSLH